SCYQYFDDDESDDELRPLLSENSASENVEYELTQRPTDDSDLDYSDSMSSSDRSSSDIPYRLFINESEDDEIRPLLSDNSASEDAEYELLTDSSGMDGDLLSSAFYIEASEISVDMDDLFVGTIFNLIGRNLEDEFLMDNDDPESDSSESPMSSTGL
ncbi:hypothetical protein IRJ41_016741, partial [Triplophysa rosa]